MIANGAEGVQVFSVMIVILIIVIETRRLRDDRGNLAWVMPIFIWMFFTLAFYGLLFWERTFGLSIDINYTWWSSVLRLLGFISVAICEGGRLLYARKMRGKRGS